MGHDLPNGFQVGHYEGYLTFLFIRRLTELLSLLDVEQELGLPHLKIIEGFEVEEGRM